MALYEARLCFRLCSPSASAWAPRLRSPSAPASASPVSRSLEKRVGPQKTIFLTVPHRFFFKQFLAITTTTTTTTTTYYDDYYYYYYYY